METFFNFLKMGFIFLVALNAIGCASYSDSAKQRNLLNEYSAHQKFEGDFAAVPRGANIIHRFDTSLIVENVTQLDEAKEVAVIEGEELGVGTEVRPQGCIVQAQYLGNSLFFPVPINPVTQKCRSKSFYYQRGFIVEGVEVEIEHSNMLGELHGAENVLFRETSTILEPTPGQTSQRWTRVTRATSTTIPVIRNGSQSDVVVTTEYDEDVQSSCDEYIKPLESDRYVIARTSSGACPPLEERGIVTAIIMRAKLH